MFFIGLLLSNFAATEGFAASPMPEALAAASSDELVVFTEEDRFYSFLPRVDGADKALIFYPGAFVPSLSYARFAKALARAGYGAFIVKVRLGFAMLSPNRADAVFEKYGDRFSSFAIAGHSIGGVVAASYVYSRYERRASIKGLLLLSAYSFGKDLSNTDLVVHSYRGTCDGLTSSAEVEARRYLLPASARIVDIQGGNHAQMGWYGPQNRDNPATITRIEQEAIIVTGAVELLEAI